MISCLKIISFRKTQAALYVKDSMHYGLVRSYIDLNQSGRLMQLLKLKVIQGLQIFLQKIHLIDYIYSMLMEYSLTLTHQTC